MLFRSALYLAVELHFPNMSDMNERKSDPPKSLKALVATASGPATSEDLSKWTFEELLALAIHYTGITKATFGVPGNKTERVLKMIKKYPMTGTARPIPIVQLIVKLNVMSADRPAHALDVTPKVSGSSFVTHTNCEYEAAVVYTKQREAKHILKAQEEDRLGDPALFQVPHTAMCRYGVFSESTDGEVQRQQRSAAIANSLVVPGKDNVGFQPSISVLPTAYVTESAYGASNVVSSALGSYTVSTTRTSVYDEMMGSEEVHDFFTSTAASGLKSTVYESSLEDGKISEVCTPPKFVAQDSPIATIVGLAPTLQPSRVGRETANMLDGLPVNKDMRRRMSDLADIHLPASAKYVYLDTKNANIAKTLLRRHPGRSMVVYYRAPKWISNIDSEKDVVQRRDPKDPDTPAKILQSGVVAWYGDFSPPEKEGSMYVQLKAATATGVTEKTIETGCKLVNRQEHEKFKHIPDVEFFLVATHVYALNPALFVRGATDLPAYGEHFYVSRRFHTCNVLNANFTMPTVDAFSRREILDVFVHLMRWALAYPLTRATCARVEIAGRMVRLIPLVNFYPFSARQEIREATEAEQRRRVKVRANPYVYGAAKKAEDPEKDNPQSATVTVAAYAPPPERKAKVKVLPSMFAQPEKTVAVSTPPPTSVPAEPDGSDEFKDDSDDDW